jgi:hypothetical protein
VPYRTHGHSGRSPDVYRVTGTGQHFKTDGISFALSIHVASFPGP